MFAYQHGYDGTLYCSSACAEAEDQQASRGASASVSASSSDGDIITGLVFIAFKLVGWIFKLLGKLFGKLYKWVFSKSIKTPLGIILRIIFIGIPVTAAVVAGFIIWKRI
jgi:hypothetical protein